VILGTSLVSYSDGLDVMTALYEVTSAGGTVGVSLGVTPTLGVFSQLIIMLLMYFGRVGILSITYAVMVNLSKNNAKGINYPDANMLVG
jgi:trk system potassium uptake protein TrkH